MLLASKGGTLKKYCLIKEKVGDIIKPPRDIRFTQLCTAEDINEGFDGRRVHNINSLYINSEQYYCLVDLYSYTVTEVQKAKTIQEYIEKYLTERYVVKEFCRYCDLLEYYTIKMKPKKGFKN